MAHDHEMYMTLADVAMELRDAQALQKYALPLEQLAERDQHPLYLAIARRARGAAHRLAGQHSKAEASLKEALTLFERLGTRWQAGRTHFELGEAALARTRKSKAREHFALALAAFEELRALPDAAKAQARLKALD